MSVPRFSVIMPAYNAERTIAAAVNSILKQSYKRWELIVVNDGSTDNTEAEVKKFKDRRIRYFKINHSGLVYARNYGNSKAEGSWIVAQDADDLSLPNRLEKFNQETEGVDVIVSGLYLNMWDDQYQCMMREYHPPGNMEKIFQAQTLGGHTAVRKELWKRRPYRMETQFCYDWMMHLDFICLNAKYKLLDEGLYEYIRYARSASQEFEKDGRRAASIEAIKQIVKDEYGKKVGPGYLRRSSKFQSR